MKLAPVTNLDTLPVLLTIHDLAALYRISTATIYRRMRKGVFRPLPWDKAPYRWLRDDVRRDLETRRPTLRPQIAERRVG